MRSGMLSTSASRLFKISPAIIRHAAIFYIRVRFRGGTFAANGSLQTISVSDGEILVHSYKFLILPHYLLCGCRG